MSASAVRPDEFAKARKYFADEVENHEMVVRQDEGFYRHLTFKAPDTIHWSFNIITWPGYLAVVGDIADGYVFSRTTDMIGFFAGDHDINPHYWAQKLQATRQPARKFTTEAFEAEMKEQLSDGYFDDEPERRERIRAAWAEHVSLGCESEHEAYELARDFECDGYRIEEFYELDFKEWDLHFLLACFAIQYGVRKYLDNGGLIVPGGVQ